MCAEVRSSAKRPKIELVCECVTCEEGYHLTAPHICEKNSLNQCGFRSKYEVIDCNDVTSDELHSFTPWTKDCMNQFNYGECTCPKNQVLCKHIAKNTHNEEKVEYQCYDSCPSDPEWSLVYLHTM